MVAKPFTKVSPVKFLKDIKKSRSRPVKPQENKVVVLSIVGSEELDTPFVTSKKLK